MISDYFAQQIQINCDILSIAIQNKISDSLDEKVNEILHSFFIYFAIAILPNCMHVDFD